MKINHKILNAPRDSKNASKTIMKDSGSNTAKHVASTDVASRACGTSISDKESVIVVAAAIALRMSNAMRFAMFQRSMR